MKRISKIAKELNISFSTIEQYIIDIGLVMDLSLNTKIDLDVEKQIYQMHNGLIKPEKIISPKKIKTKKTQINFTQKLPKEFDADNPYEGEIIKIATSENIFANRDLLEKNINGKNIKTIFTDLEAFTICNGIENSFAKKIAREFFFSSLKNDLNTFNAHQIATSTLEKYGPELISHVISLPPLPFKALDASQIFSELDKRRNTQDFPILRIGYSNKNNNIEKIQISFYSEKVDNKIIRNNNVLLVKNRTTGENLMKVSRKGIVVTENDASQIIPILQVFISFSKDTKKAILNYGLETGECSVCGRELTTKESIRLGIGPVCRQNIGYY